MYMELRAPRFNCKIERIVAETHTFRRNRETIKHAFQRPQLCPQLKQKITMKTTFCGHPKIEVLPKAFRNEKTKSRKLKENFWDPSTEYCLNDYLPCHDKEAQ